MDVASLGIFAKLVNWEVVASVVLVVEFIKIYMPDKMEPKLLPAISIIMGGLISFIPNVDISIAVGLVSGFVATSVYKAGFTGVEKIVGTVIKGINGKK